jgi:flagellar assembly protein FliH
LNRTAKSPAKFLFDSDFAPGSVSKPSIALADHERIVKETETLAYSSGCKSAEAAARVDAERRAATALERIASGIEALARTLTAVEARLETEAVEVAAAIGRKLAPELVAREPLTEMAALASECFRQLVATPHVVVRVNDALMASARERLDDIVRARGLESRLVVLAEPDIPPGDCRIEWADGGIVRDTAAATAAVDEAVSRYVKARLGAFPAASNPMPGISWRIDR